MPSSRSTTLLPLAVAALLALPTGLASNAIYERMGLDRPFDVAYVPEGRALAFLSPGIRLTIGNLYWLLTVQYIGDFRADQRGWEKLFPMVDLVTDADPRHGYAYQSAGIVLSTRGRLEESDAILRKGMEKGPNWWSYPFYVAFNNYFYRGDYAEAARWAEIAARTPGASPNISQLALAMKVKSGSPEDAVRFLEEMVGVAKDDSTRAAFEEQYRLALLQRDFHLLDQAVAAYRTARGRPPSSVGELVEAGLLAAIPKEPFGGRYELRADGKVHSTARDFRFQPAEPWRGKLYLPPAQPKAAPPPLLARPPTRGTR